MALLLSLLSSSALAATYYASPTGSDGAAGTELDPWSLEHANDTVVAGDTVLLIDGNYDTAIEPANSGSEGAPISYQAVNQHQATFSNGFPSAAAVELSNHSYVVVDGIRSDSVHRWVVAEGTDTHHITVQNGSFSDSAGWESMRFRDIGDHITVRNNHIENGTDSLHLRGGQFHLVEDNVFVDAGHTCLVLMDVQFSVVRGNTLSNSLDEKLMEVFSLRGAIAQPEKSEYNLIEENWFGPADLTGIQYAGSRSIIRRNVFIDSDIGMNFANYGGSDPSDDPEAWWDEQNRFYNNVVYGNARGVWTATLNSLPPLGAVYGDNLVINNLIEANAQSVSVDWDAIPTDLQVRNNNIHQQTSSDVFWWLDKPDDYFYTIAEIESDYAADYSGNTEHTPQFVDAQGGDFHLVEGSPGIDAAVALTTTTSAGSGTVVVVDDALFFSDGHGLVDGDKIVIGTERVTIVAVDYVVRELTVTPELSWEAGAGVFTDFEGEAPDLGIFEFGATDTDTTPDTGPTDTEETDTGETDPASSSSTDSKSGCGCASTGGSWVGWLGWLGVLGWTRRRS